MCVRLQRLILALALLLPYPMLGETVYKSRGPSGPVYSDVPSPGSQRVDLPPSNIAQPPPKPVAVPTPPAETTSAQEPELAPYRALRITQPEDNGSASDNTALFEVRVAVEPDLRAALGHAFVVTLNGKSVGRRYVRTEMMIPPEFFDDGMRANERFRLDVGIVDRDGRVLMRAAPVEFVMRHVAMRRGMPQRPIQSYPGR